MLRSTAKTPKSIPHKSKTTKSVKTKAVRNKPRRSLSTILTGEAEPLLPPKKKQSTPEPSQAPQAEHPQQPQPPQLNFNDPQVIQVVGSWNTFIRNKSSSVFQKALQSLLVARNAIPFPTKDDFLNPQAHILKSLLAHNLVMKANDTSHDGLPDEVVHDSPLNPPQNGASTAQLFHLMDFFKVLQNDEGTEFKPGKVNIYQQFKPGTHQTDPSNYNKAQIEAKIKSAKRLGLDATNHAETILDVFVQCVEVAGGLDFRELIVTDDRPHSHQIFLQQAKNIPPHGELLSSDFSRNTASPFAQQILQTVPNAMQTVEQLTHHLEAENDVQKLSQMSKGIGQHDVLSAWRSQNKDLNQRFDQSTFNPLITFNEDEMINIKGLILRQVLQKMLTMHYLFSPFQLAFVSIPSTIKQDTEQLTKYYTARDEALYDIEPGDSLEVKQRKRASKLPALQPVEKLVALTEFPGYQAIWSGKSNLVIENISKDQGDALSAKFNEMVMQRGLFNYAKFQAAAIERFPQIKQGEQVEPKLMLAFLKEELGNMMVKQGVFGKKGDEQCIPKKSHYGLQYGSKITQNIVDQLDDDGFSYVDEATGKTSHVKIYELELLKQMRKFGIITKANEDEFLINTLSPIILPDEPKEVIDLKQSLIDNKVLPAHAPGIQQPHLPGQKPDLNDPNALSPFQHLLLSTLFAEVKGGDNDPNSSFPIPVDDEQLDQLIEAGHAKIISVDPITNRKIARAVESDNPVEIKGWVRSEEHDAQLADGSMNHVDQALFKMNIHQLREFSTQQYIHEVAIDTAQRHPESFALFTRDIHTTSLPVEDMNDLRFMASQMATQMLLRGQYRSDQELAGRSPESPPPVYNHVLFTTPEQYQESKTFFLSKAPTGDKH